MGNCGQVGDHSHCNQQLARAYIDAGCIRVQDGQFLRPFLLTSLPLAPSSTGRLPKARIKGKLPIELVVVKADERHHTSVRKPRTHAYRRASEAARVGAGCCCHPTGANHLSLIALPLFLCHPVSGKRQLHASRYRIPLWQPFGLTDRRPSSTQLGLGARSEQLNGI